MWYKIKSNISNKSRKLYQTSRKALRYMGLNNKDLQEKFPLRRFGNKQTSIQTSLEGKITFVKKRKFKFKEQKWKSSRLLQLYSAYE